MKALEKSCQERIGEWPKILPYALWVDCTTHNTVTGYMPFEFMYGQKPLMPIEEAVLTWMILPWKKDVSRDDLLALRIHQLERQHDDIEEVKLKLKDDHLKNKDLFDQKCR